MIRPLRRTHRTVMLILAVVLPALLAAAVVLREPSPRQRPWPVALDR